MNKYTLTLTRCPGKPRLRSTFGAACLLIGVLAVTGCNKAIDSYVAAKEKSKANEAARQEKRAAAEAIDFNALDFAKLEALEKSELQLAQVKRGDDSRVHYAWHGVATNLLTVRGEVERQAKILVDADILNVGTITNASQRKISQQFVDRRMLANQYGTALHNWEHTLQTIEGKYVNELNKFQVSPGRLSTEWESLGKVLSDPLPTGLKDRVSQELAICAAEKEVALQYNYAVGSMETYYQRKPSIVNNSQAVPTRQLPWETKGAGANSMVNDAREEFEEKVAKLEQLKKAARQLREQTSNPKTPGQVAAQ